MGKGKKKSTARSIWIVLSVALVAGLFGFWFIRGRNEN
jgi:hypothetical protein